MYRIHRVRLRIRLNLPTYWELIFCVGGKFSHVELKRVKNVCKSMSWPEQCAQLQYDVPVVHVDF